MITSMLTDRYELTMVAAALRSGTGARRSVFEVFARRLPTGRRYGVVCGTRRLLEAVADFRFTDDELHELGSIVDAATLRWLADYRFSGDIWGYPEGEVYLPGSPILVVESSFAEAILLETLVLSILNHDCAVAAAASRMVVAAQGRPCFEMGSRRTHERAAVAAARAAYVGGFSGTSNLRAGAEYGIPTVGTAAHSFILLHGSERDAFQAQVDAYGSGTTLLVDTYDVNQGVRTAVEVAGPALGGVRIDSGDSLEQAYCVRAQLDSMGARETKIVVTGDLDEYAIEALAAGPVDSYGVGSRLVTGSGAPTAGLVYKLVAHQDTSGALIAVAKTSQDKASHGGRKWALRRRADGTAVAEVIGIDTIPRNTGNDRWLLTRLMHDGQTVALEPATQPRRRHAAALAELPATGRQISPGAPAIPTVIEYQQHARPER